jgi:hypothetical protein
MLAEQATAPAHQFDTSIQQYEASMLGMWVFLLTEIAFWCSPGNTLKIAKGQSARQLSFASAMPLLAEALSFKVSALPPNEAAPALVKRSGSVPSVRVAVF